MACDLAVSSCAKCRPGPGHWGGLLNDDSYMSYTEVKNTMTLYIMTIWAFVYSLHEIFSIN